MKESKDSKSRTITKVLSRLLPELAIIIVALDIVMRGFEFIPKFEMSNVENNSVVVVELMPFITLILILTIALGYAKEIATRVVMYFKNK